VLSRASWSWKRRSFELGALGALVACSLTGCPKPTVPSARSSDGGAAVAVARDASAVDPCADLSAQERDSVLARVGETSLTLCDFARRLAGQNPYLRARLNTAEARRSLVRAWVDGELLAAEARQRGLDREPSVRNAVLSQLARQVESEVRAGVAPAVVSEADVERYYREHIAEYETPEQVRFAHVVLSSQADADRVLAEARRVATDDAAWRALVRRETRDDVTRETGGDVGFVSREGSTQVPREVAEAAFRLREVGEVLAQVVSSPRGGANHGPGFHVLRMVARRDALRRPLDDVRRAIRNRLFEERSDQAQTRAVRDLLERLRRESPVQVDESVLSQVRIDLPPEATPPAMRASVGQPMLPPGVTLPAAGTTPAPR
jgi:peptidyl-prolyl cis-trans isomerase C